MLLLLLFFFLTATGQVWRGNLKNQHFTSNLSSRFLVRGSAVTAGSSMVDERTSWRYFFCQAVSIMSSVKQAASAALQPNPTWAEAKPICQAAMISPEPSRNKLLSYPTVKLHRAAGQGQVTEMPPIPGAPEVKKRLKTGGNINHINLCRWRRWPAISQQQLYQTLFHAVINSQKKKTSSRTFNTYMR